MVWTIEDVKGSDLKRLCYDSDAIIGIDASF